MKKAKQSTKKKKNHKKKNPASQQKKKSSSHAGTVEKKPIAPKPVRIPRKKAADKTSDGNGVILGNMGKARQFLRESKTELKKVKWPTKKELLASTAVVIFLTLLMAFYFWLVDLGLMTIIKGVLA